MSTATIARARSIVLTLVAPGRYKAASQSHPGHQHDVTATVYEYPACNMAGCSCTCDHCAEATSAGLLHVGCRSGQKRERMTLNCTCPGGGRRDEHGSSTCVHAIALGLRIIDNPAERPAAATFAGDPFEGL